MAVMSSVGLCFSQGTLNLSAPYQIKSIQLLLSYRVTPVTALKARQAQELSPELLLPLPQLCAAAMRPWKAPFRHCMLGEALQVGPALWVTSGPPPPQGPSRDLYCAA